MSLHTSVGAERFELSTSRTRTVRATGLRYAPKGKRANYTIAICFGKLWVEQNHLTINIETTGHAIIALAYDQTGRHGFCYFKGDARFKQLWIDILDVDDTQTN